MIINADAIQWAKDYEGELFHALICDPPYELAFMSKDWDNTGVSFDPETWKAFYNILHPGAFGMAFGGSRTAHRMAVAIEDAGFIIHPQMSWVYGSGFPKATRIDTQIDKKAGKEREIIEHTGQRCGVFAHSGSGKEQNVEDYEKVITAPATDLAKQWEGHRYGLQALKPAGEPIIVFQRPYEGRPVDCITETGAGALNIDGGRIGVASDKKDGWRPNSYDKNYHYGDNGQFLANIGESIGKKHVQGRWPSNFVLTHSPQCQMVGYRDADSYQINRFTDGAKPFGNGAGHEFETEEVEGGRVPVWECVDGCPVKALDKQSGHLTSGSKVGEYGSWGTQSGIYGKGKTYPQKSAGSFGTASRFFHQSHWAIENADPFVYQAKVSVNERNAGLNGEKCTHPTLKPIALIEHLATLLLPPKEYAPRRILVPFAGVASEVIGCWRAGWEEITGIELEAEYAEIGKARLEYWKKQGVQLDLFGV